MKIKVGPLCFGFAISLLISNQVFATAYVVPAENESLIGKKQYSATHSGETVASIAKKYDLGYNAIVSANPQIDFNYVVQPNQPLQVATQHLLPNQPREGIVINLPEMRMYYYLPGSNKVLTYPVGIGKIGKTIPIKRAVVITKKKDPTWTPPEDIREFNLQQGIELPKVMPAGPDNPLGPYAIYMSIPTYLIHSTIFPESVGTRASFGCIRMYESDIEDFFPSVKRGIPIVITNSPVKVGWQKDHLLMEAHQPLSEHENDYESSLPGAVSLINSASDTTPTLVDWQLVYYIAKTRDGLPHDVGVKITS